MIINDYKNRLSVLDFKFFMQELKCDQEKIFVLCNEMNFNIV